MEFLIRKDVNTDVNLHKKMTRFDYSYTELPRKFYSYTKPILNDNFEFVLKNNFLLRELNIRVRDNLQLKNFLFSKNNFEKSYSQIFGSSIWSFYKLGGWKSYNDWRIYF